jgi:fused signal recognition particle receptor
LRRIVVDKKGLFSKLKDGLVKTRANIANRVDELFKYYTEVNDQLFDEMEETLIMADVGINASGRIISSLRKRVKDEKIGNISKIKTLLKEEITRIFITDSEDSSTRWPKVFLITGVNGVGKTTAIGKLAAYYKTQGKKVLIAAGDTFRAAAIDQLEVWSKRADVDIVKHEQGSDAGAVVFDAISAAKSRKVDLLICDTAGRLHNKKNLMSELSKLNRIIDREYNEAQKEIFLVLDATTGQNAISQARIFNEAVNVNGIIITKLDGTAKGGVAIAVKSEFNIPIKYIGVGEGIDDLQPFDANDFVEALLEP